MNKKNEARNYLLPYGPDLVYNSLHRVPLTPKPELYVLSKKQIPEEVNFQIAPSWYKFFPPFLRFGAILITVMVCLLRPENYVEVRDLQHNSQFDPDSVPDYALASAGAEIYDDPSAVTYFTHLLKFSFLTVSTASYANGPMSILQPWKSAGECWAFAGSEASVLIRLSHLIVPSYFTVEHIPKNLSPTGDIASALRHFSIYAVDIEDKTLKEHMGSFEYMAQGPPTQCFELDRVQYPTRILELQINSNQGHKDYTCVYKIRVHGSLFKL